CCPALCRCRSCQTIQQASEAAPNQLFDGPPVAIPLLQLVVIEMALGAAIDARAPRAVAGRAALDAGNEHVRGFRARSRRCMARFASDRTMRAVAELAAGKPGLPFRPGLDIVAADLIHLLHHGKIAVHSCVLVAIPALV